MNKFKKEKQLCFDDILIVPQESDIMSRSHVDLSMNLNSSSRLSLPIIASPMDTVCEEDMAVEIAKHGGVGIIHRFMDEDKQVSMVKNIADHFLAVGAAVGAKENYMKHAEKLVDAGAAVVLVDTANGHSKYAIDAVKNISDEFDNSIHIMAGNVATADGFIRLAEAGANSIRVGIGGGSVCTTRIISGHGIPTLSSIIDCKEIKERESLDVGIIADGGIKSTGDMIKSFAAGADIVMLGSMLAGTDQSPGAIIGSGENRFKLFRGMASLEANKGKDIPVAEGVATTVAYKGDVKKIFASIRGGLGSGCSYSGVSKLRDLYENALYVEVSSLSVTENRPHAML